jgi:hypothetical protein
VETNNGNDKAVQAAVEWWVARALEKNKTIPLEAIAAFKLLLHAKVKAALAEHWHTTLKTDYYPEGKLAEAAFEAKINGSEFPTKTLMTIAPTEVLVRQNYSTSRSVVYSEAESAL